MITLLDIEMADAPVVALIDGSVERLDEAALRQTARALSAAVGPATVSRSYRHPYAVVGWHTGPVGVDIERVAGCDEPFARSISTPAEQARTAGASCSEIVSLWSSKEALAKALGDAVQYDPRRLESPVGWREGAAGPWRARALPAPDGYCVWVCWRRHDLKATDSAMPTGGHELTIHHEPR